MLAAVTITFGDAAPSTLSIVREWAQILSPFIAILAVVLTVNWNDRKNRATELRKRLCTGLDEIEKSTDSLLKQVDSHLTVGHKDLTDFLLERAKITSDYHRLFDQVTVLRHNFDVKTSFKLEEDFHRIYNAVFEEPFGSSDPAVRVDSASARINLIRTSKREWLFALHKLRRACLVGKARLALVPKE
jgi:hypothetical protein